jgi:hypothetical protein
MEIDYAKAALDLLLFWYLLRGLGLALGYAYKLHQEGFRPGEVIATCFISLLFWPFVDGLSAALSRGKPS